MENNDSIELQSNSKRARIEVDLANLPTDPCLQKKKKKKKKKKIYYTHVDRS
jgi:hypothetical protein